MTTLLLAHAAATLAMGGLVWFVQVVHYPLFARVGEEAFPAYEAAHAERTTWVVAPLMVVEAMTAAALLVAEPGALTLAGLLLVVALWLSTALVQVPLHRALSAGFDARAHARLVATNGVRTGLWTARCGIALALLA